MLGSKQTLEMIESAKLDNCRMVLLGDIKQLPAIDAGRAFQDAQELGQLHVVTAGGKYPAKDGIYQTTG